MTIIVGIAAIVSIVALMKAQEKKDASKKIVYDYRENPEVLDEFIH